MRLGARNSKKTAGKSTTVFNHQQLIFMDVKMSPIHKTAKCLEGQMQIYGGLVPPMEGMAVAWNRPMVFRSFKLCGVHRLQAVHGGLEPLFRLRGLQAVHGGLVPLLRLHHHRALPGGVELLCPGECPGGGLEPLHPAE